VQPSFITHHSSLITGQAVLLEVISEKTGYPVEMLELDMELDADLGIDSIKRVEIFSAIQERLPQAPPVKSEHLGTLRTLRQVVNFLSSIPEAPGSVKAQSAIAEMGNGESPGIKNSPTMISHHSSLITPQTVLLEIVAE